MKKRQFSYILLIIISIAYSCTENQISSVPQQKELPSSLLLEAQSFFKQSLKKAVYTRGVADVYGESKHSAFIPSNFIPQWNKSKIIEKKSEIDVYIPIVTFEKYYLKGQDGRKRNILQTLVYNKEVNESKCYILSLCALDEQENYMLINNFIENDVKSSFTGVVWYTTLEGKMISIEAYENGRVICDTRTMERAKILNISYLENALITKANTSAYSSNEDSGGGDHTEKDICPRCRLYINFCQCCIHYPYPDKKSLCSVCRTPPSDPVRCQVCGNLYIFCTCQKPKDPLDKNKPPLPGQLVKCQNCGKQVIYNQICSECGFKNKYKNN